MGFYFLKGDFIMDLLIEEDLAGLGIAGDLKTALLVEGNL